MDKNYFVISSLEKFINTTRALVYNGFGKKEDDDIDDNFLSMMTLGEEETNEIESILTLEECRSLILPALKKQKNKITNKIRYLINEDSLYHILETLNARMVSNILSNLVKKDILETAFDSEQNDFIFWIKNEEKEETN